MLQPGIVEAADRALVALKKMRAGMRADQVIQNKRKIKSEVSTLFAHKKKPKLCKPVAWKHKFYCLAYVGQDRVPTSDTDKDELFQAGLGRRILSLTHWILLRKSSKSTSLPGFHNCEKVVGFDS